MTSKKRIYTLMWRNPSGVHGDQPVEWVGQPRAYKRFPNASDSAMAEVRFPNGLVDFVALTSLYTQAVTA